MDRRSALTALTAGAAGLMTLGDSREAFAQQARSAPNALRNAQEGAGRGLPRLKITDVKVFRLAVGNQNLCVCKVFTDEPGLYGVGDGNHAERPYLVAETIEKYVAPFIKGRYVDEIEKLWNELWVAPYWRGSVDASNAMSAIDGALWDIMGKRAGMPVYDLLGGKVRDGCRMFTNVNGADGPRNDGIRRGIEQGYQHFRIYVPTPDMPGAGVPGTAGRPAAGAGPANAASGRRRGHEGARVNAVVKAFDNVRETFGFDIEIGHDIHEALSPQSCLVLAGAVEKHRVWFFEEPFGPEDIQWYRVLREQSAVGVSTGELFVSANDWLPLVANRWVDYLRFHVSAIGGLSQVRKIAHCMEYFGVRTSFHGPGNVSPIGHAVNLHLELSLMNFGVGEGGAFNEQYQELFPGCPEMRGAVRYANNRPGLGIDIDEKVAAKYPPIGLGSNRGAWDAEGTPAKP